MMRGRRSVTLDLKIDDGAEAALAPGRQGRRADRGLPARRDGAPRASAPTCCLARNPTLVYGRMTGWGQDGPLARARRPRHQLHRARRRAARDRPRRRGAGAAAQPGRRLRRRRHAARASASPAALIEAQRSRPAARWSTRRWSTAPSLLATMFSGMLAAGAWSETRGANILDTGAPWYDTYETQRRQVRRDRRDRAEVLRRAARAARHRRRD